MEQGSLKKITSGILITVNHARVLQFHSRSTAVTNNINISNNKMRQTEVRIFLFNKK